MTPSPQRSKTESMKAPRRDALPVARARAPSNRSKTPPNTTRMPARIQLWPAAAIAARIAIPKPIRVSAFGVRPSLAEGEGDRDGDAADAGPRLRADHRAAHEAARSRSPARGDPEDGGLAALELGERLRAEPTDRLAADPPGRDEPGGAQPPDVPRDERLRQPDRSRRARRRSPRPWARTRTIRRRFTSARALWTSAQLAQLVRLEDGVGDRAADAGAGRDSGSGAPSVERRRINGGLYQRWLILGAPGAGVKTVRGATRAAATVPPCTLRR